HYGNLQPQSFTCVYPGALLHLSPTPLRLISPLCLAPISVFRPPPLLCQVLTASSEPHHLTRLPTAPLRKR
ncbi:hypothetical protein INR49_002478, partial [Caranx melampygus]